MENKHYFYVLHCKDNSFYGGYTTDPKRRINEHNTGTGAKYTRPVSRRPVTMIHLEVFPTRQEATKAEYHFKKQPRKRKERYLRTAKTACVIRAFEESDGKSVSELMKRNFLEINSKDYPLEQMIALTEEYTAEKLVTQAEHAHMYVAELGDRIVGTATICPYYDSSTESIILSFFVLPEYHSKGIGRALMTQLENDPFYTRADRIEIPSSRTAVTFYEQFGFSIIDSTAPEDEHGYIRLEKRLSELDR